VKRPSKVHLGQNWPSGATLFVIAGAIALIAGIGSLVWPDPGGFRARRKGPPAPTGERSWPG
jgi:hypothetical protein